MNIFDSKIDEMYLYNVLHKRSDNYSISRLEKKKDEIIEYFNNLQINTISVDNMLDYAFCKYILELNNDENKFQELKKDIIKIIGKFAEQDVNKFISDNYLNIYKLKITDIQKNILIQLIIKEIIIRKIQININKLLDTYSLIIFDTKRFLAEYKNAFWKKIAQKSFIQKLLKYRYISFIDFLKGNNVLLKNNKKYDKIINLIIEYTLDDQDVCRKADNSQQLIYFLEYVKDYRVKEIKEKYTDILNDKNNYIQENGVKFDRKIDFSDIYENFDETFQSKKLNEIQKISLIFATRKNNKVCMAVESIKNVQLPITDILIGNRAHSYYRPFVKMVFEQLYLRHEMNLFLNYYLKYVGYEKFEDILTGMISDIYEYIIFENNDKEYYKELSHNIITTIKKYKDSDNTKFDMYASSLFLINFLEKILRELFIKACLDKKEYIGNYTLKDIFEDKRNIALKTLIGEHLFLWIKYYLYHDEEIRNGIVIKEGLDLRNNFAHGTYDLTQDFTNYYYLLLFITLNLLLALEINVITYPTFRTERILKKIINKSNINKFDKI